MIHTALVSEYPTHAHALRALMTMPHGTPYRGIWLMPAQGNAEPVAVHVFGHPVDTSDVDLARRGWRLA